MADQVNDETLELYLKAEIIRILLKHPYDRQPDGCRKEAIAVGSNLVIGDNYQEFKAIKIPNPKDYNLDNSESFEWYSYRMERMLPQTDNIETIEEDLKELMKNEGNETTNVDVNDVVSEIPLLQDLRETNDGEQEKTESKVLVQIITMPDGSEFPIYMSTDESKDGNINSDARTSTAHSTKGNSSTQSNPVKQQPNLVRENSPKANYDLSSLWEEDYTKVCEIDYQIEVINNSHGWGTLSRNLINEILANTKARIDYRKVLSGFRASVLSSKRSLTRMRPNRRSGFDNMGSIRRFNTNILVAVDVSGSVNDESLRHFFSIINRTFKYGIEKLDLIQFDTEIKSVETMEKKQKSVAIKGRGGTDFQVVFDYAVSHQEYDGIIIFTDGDARIPTKSPKMKCKVAWVCNTKDGYYKNHSWMNKLGHCCLMEV